MANNQKSSPQIVGFFPANAGSGLASTALSAAATWLAYSFIPDTSKTVNNIWVFASAVNGTLTSLSCDIYSDSTAGLPNASLATTTTVNALPTGAAWVEFTGFTLAVTAGTRYWIVLKNLTATPASNFPTYAHGVAGTGQSIGGFSAASLGLWDATKVSTINSGTAWTTALRPASCGWRIDYSDGTYAGEPVQAMGVTLGASAAFGSNEVGITFISPANAVWNVRGIVFGLAKRGTPTGNARFRLYNNTTLLATTAVIPPGNIALTVDYLFAYFSSNQLILPGTKVRATIGNTAADSSSNCYGASEYTIHNDANSKALFTFGTAANPGNVIKKTFFNGSTWTDTDTVIMTFGLILDSEGEYSPPWPRVNPNLTGGFA